MARGAGFQRHGRAGEYGGLALRNVDQVAVWEQLGRVTNALCWCFSEPHQLDVRGLQTHDQLQRYVLPLMTTASARSATRSPRRNRVRTW